MDIVKILSIVVGAISLFGGLAVVFNQARKGNLIDILTQENITLTRQKTEALSDSARLEAERDSYRQQFETEQEHSKQLQELAQGSPQLVILTDEFKKFGSAIQKQTDLFQQYMKAQDKK